LSNVLGDPTLELHDSNGMTLVSNAAILAGKNGGTGIGLVEVYNLR
jgi:hypothetical protein